MRIEWFTLMGCGERQNSLSHTGPTADGAIASLYDSVSYTPIVLRDCGKTARKCLLRDLLDDEHKSSYPASSNPSLPANHKVCQIIPRKVLSFLMK